VYTAMDMHFFTLEITRVCTRRLIFLHKWIYILHIWNYTCVHKLIYIFGNVELNYAHIGLTFLRMWIYMSVHMCLTFLHKWTHVCPHMDLYFCTRGTKNLSTNRFTLLHTWNYTCQHKWIYILRHVVLQVCARGYIFHTCKYMYAHVHLYFCK
jgi:hypothetical protein